jgi:hypothetical protein
MWRNIKPILKEFHVKNIIEIGSRDGKNTRNLLDYCNKNNGHLICIDPLPQYDYKKLEEENPNSFKQYKDLSLNVLNKILNDGEKIDAVLIDGDHNWYTVFNELKLIDKCDNFPLVFLHDVSWPYGRRDLYYNPDEIPKEYLQKISKKGVLFNGLGDEGINYGANHAEKESNENNGVLTAAEDFIKISSKNLTLYVFDYQVGLGIICNEEQNSKLEKDRIIYDLYSKCLKYEQTNRIKGSFREKKIQKELDSKNQIIFQQKEEMKKLKNTINKYKNSNSWKITTPIRKIVSKIKK